MTGESNQEKFDTRVRLVDEHLRAENAHDLDAIMETFGRNPRFNLNGVSLDGSENIQAMYSGFGFREQGSFSDIKVEKKQQHVGEESIVVEVVLNAKHTGNFQGIAATNREFEIPLCAIFEFDGEEKLAGERVYFDGASLLRQLGVLS